MNKIAIFVSSFDGYSDLWETFFRIFSINFKNCPYPIYLSSNFKEYKFPNLTNICTGEEISWMHRTIKAIETIKEDYILFMLEDYLIGKKVDNNLIEDAVIFMKKNNVDYYRLLDIPKSEGVFRNINYLGKINAKQKYGVNTICSIWKKDYLIKILYEANYVESAWDFEVFLCNKFNSYENKFLENCCVDRRDILAIKNGVYRGKWFRTTIKYFKNNGIDIDIKDREIMTLRENLIFDIKSSIDRLLSVKRKEKIKKFLRNIGFDFLSDKKMEEK